MSEITEFKETIGELVYKDFKEYDLSIYWSDREVSPNNISSPALFILNQATSYNAPCDYTVPIYFVFLLQNMDLPDFRENERLLEDMAIKLIKLLDNQKDYPLQFNKKSPVISQNVKSKEENQKNNEIYGTFIRIEYILTYDILNDNVDCLG